MMHAYRLITCRIAAKRLRRDAGATGHNARERDTGERRARGGNGLVAIPVGSTCRIAAKRLRRPRRDAGADWPHATSARERDTGERRATGRWQHLPDRGHAMPRAHVATPGPLATSARERDTGERGYVGGDGGDGSAPAESPARGGDAWAAVGQRRDRQRPEPSSGSQELSSLPRTHSKIMLDSLVFLDVPTHERIER